MTDSPSTIVRAMSVLRVVADGSGSVGVKDVSDALGLPMSTSHRLLDLLVESGFVEKDRKQRRYNVGLEFFRLAQIVTQKTSLSSLLQPILDDLAAATGETAIFAAYLASEACMTYAAKSDSPHVLRFRISLSTHLPLEWGASGLAILAYLPAAVKARVLEKSRPSPVAGTRLTSDELDARLDAVRQRGYAISRSEKLPDSVGVAAPLRSTLGKVLGSVALTIPTIRFAPEKTDQYAELLIRRAQRFASGGA